MKEAWQLGRWECSVTLHLDKCVWQLVTLAWFTAFLRIVLMTVGIPGFENVL